MKKRTESLIKKTPLKKLDSALLTITLINEAEDAGLDSEKIFTAISLASALHIGQTRANRGDLPRTPYIEHPLRNAIRILRWGCVEQDVIIAAILHDTVEDCSKKFVASFGIDVNSCSEEDARKALRMHIRNEFGEEVDRIVAKVTNDYVPKEISAKLDRMAKGEIYRQHVIKNLVGDYRVLLVKFSDFVDNATGLHHNDIPKNAERVRNLAFKYRPLIKVFRSEIGTEPARLQVSDEGIVDMLRHLDATSERLDKIINR